MAKTKTKEKIVIKEDPKEEPKKEAPKAPEFDPSLPESKQRWLR